MSSAGPASDPRAPTARRRSSGSSSTSAEQRNSRNLAAFVASTTPRFEEASAAEDPPLADVWRYYDEPYGHEVPLVLEDGVESYAFYTPHLSAIQVYGRARDEGADGRREPDEENDPRARGGNAAAAAAAAAAAEDAVKLVEFFETAKPNHRVPLLDRIGELDEAHEGVLTGSTADLDCSRSWYSISWFPILCDQYTSDAVRGCFLTYHRFRAGPCPFAIDDDIREMGGMPPPAAAADPAATPECDHECCQLQSGGTACHFLNVCGIVPYKVREPTWEGCLAATAATSTGLNAHCERHEHPGLAELRSSADRFLSDGNVRHPDFLHFSRGN